MSGAGDSCLKICIVGSGGVGKSCVTLRFLKDKFVDYYDPTIEEGYRKFMNVDGHEYSIEIIDTAGQEEFASFRDNALNYGHAFILVLAMNSPSSWEELVELHRKIMRIKDTEKVPCAILGNKCDMVNEIVVSIGDVKAYAEPFGIPVFEVSAKTGQNISLGFSELVRQVLALSPAILRQTNTDPTAGPGSQRGAGASRGGLADQTPKSDSGCCSVL